MVGSYVSLVETLESQTSEMGDVGERPLREVSSSMVKDEIQGEPEFILPLENCPSIGCINYIRD